MITYAPVKLGTIPTRAVKSSKELTDGMRFWLDEDKGSGYHTAYFRHTKRSPRRVHVKVTKVTDTCLFLEKI